MTPMVLLTLLFTNPLKESPPLGVKFAPNLHKLLPLPSADECRIVEPPAAEMVRSASGFKERTGKAA